MSKPDVIETDDLDDKDKDIEIELDESGKLVEPEEEENPNVADQLKTAPDEVKPEETVSTPEERLNQFFKDDPETREAYGEDIKKRIGKLTYGKKEAERQNEASLEYARNVQKENVQLKATQNDQNSAFITEHKTRLESQVTAAKRSYEEAFANNDAPAMADANAAIATAASQLTQAGQTESRFKRMRESQEKEIPQSEFTPEPTPVQQSKTPNIDPKAEQWAERNAWFGEDKELTDAVISIHQKLINEDGYLPQSDAYYEQLDVRIKRNYPNHAKLGTTVKTLEPVDSVVTPVVTHGHVSSKNRKVKLTPAQVQTAHNLGVPLSEYAKYVPVKK